MKSVKFDLADIKKAASEERVAREKVTAEASALVTAIRTTAAGIEKATASGDMEKVIELQDLKLKQEKDLGELRSRLAGVKSYDVRDAAVTRWNAYAGAYNAEFLPRYEEYKKARKALCEAYMQLVEMQRVALVNRAELRALGIKCDPKESPDMTQLELLDNKQIPEIDFVSAEIPGHRFGLQMVARSRSGIDKDDMEDRNVDYRLRLYAAGKLNGCGGAFPE